MITHPSNSWSWKCKVWYDDSTFTFVAMFQKHMCLYNGAKTCTHAYTHKLDSAHVDVDVFNLLYPCTCVYTRAKVMLWMFVEHRINTIDMFNNSYNLCSFAKPQILAETHMFCFKHTHTHCAHTWTRYRHQISITHRGTVASHMLLSSIHKSLPPYPRAYRFSVNMRILDKRGSGGCYGV